MRDVRGGGSTIRAICAALGLAAAALQAGCITPAHRAVIPEGLLPSARVEAVRSARFWGDEVTPEIQLAIAEQYRQVRDAARAGTRVGSTGKADFLAISGGGADGAFAAGLLTGWSRSGNRPAFEVVTGVSTGALAAPFAFLGPDYDPQLAQIYTAYGDRDIFHDRGLLGLAGNGLYDPAPLRGLIRHYMTETVLDRIAVEYRLGRRLLVQTTNIDAQRPVIWDLSAICAGARPDRRDLVVNILLASAAIPAIFPPVRVTVLANDGRRYDELHVDGGVVAQVFFAPPQIRLADYEQATFGQTRSRTLYVIRNGRLQPAYDVTQENTMAVARRSIDTLTKYQGIADLSRLERLARIGRARLVYTAIPSGFNLRPASEFDRAYMRRLFEVGHDAGRSGAWMVGPPTTPVLADPRSTTRRQSLGRLGVVREALQRLAAKAQ
ncbi:patatin-like phospholipase family protein [Phreatobacter stygius]|nr:patatin-like phospholipase family protein [Phreatobacter stygius]